MGTEEAPEKRRVFEFDVFLSHNRNDGSERIKSLLQDSGLRVWHDSNADLRNRKIRHSVTIAARNCRWIFVCLGDNFHDSPWCRAEYLPALAAQKRARCTRVATILHGSQRKIPAELINAPGFDCSGSIPDSLIRMLQESNHVVMMPPPPRVLSPEALATASLLAIQINRSSSDRVDRTLLALTDSAKSFLDRDPGADYEIFLARNFVCALPPKLTKTQQLISAVFELAGLIAASNVDNRANAMYLLEWLAQQKLHENALRAIVDILAVEKSPVLIRQAIETLERLGAVFSDLPSSVLIRGFLEAGDEVHLTSKYLESVPAAVRLKTQLGISVDESLLSPSERLYLCGERLAYLIERPAVSEYEHHLDVVRSLLGLSDLEICFREIYALFFDREKTPKRSDFDMSNVETLLQMYCLLVEQSEVREGLPLLYAEEYVMDFVLPPLLLCCTFPEYTAQAAALYQRMCTLMTKSTKFAHEVPAYLQASEKACSKSGIQDWNQLFDWMLLDKAEQQRRNREMFEGEETID
jgi:hypothetical protein